MKSLRLVLSVVVTGLLLSGCFYAHVKTPLDRDADRTQMGQKTGRASNHSVLWAVAWGDASTAAAAQNGGLTTVNHMDSEFYSILFGLYTESTTIVYGE